MVIDMDGTFMLTIDMGFYISVLYMALATVLLEDPHPWQEFRVLVVALNKYPHHSSIIFL